MKPSYKRYSSPGAVVVLTVLVIVVLPLALFKFVGGIVAPEFVDSVSQHFQSFVAGLSSSMVDGLKDAFLGLVVLAAAIYLSCLVHSVMRGNKSQLRGEKTRRAA